MHHIATVIYPSPPAPTTSALCDLIRGAFPEARIVEVEDGLEVAIEAGRMFVEIDDRAPESLDADGRPIAPPDPSASWPDDAEAHELFGEDEVAPETGRRADAGDATTAARFAEATRYVHLEGDFGDPTDVISLIEVFLRATPDAAATDAAGEPLPLAR